jgi:two-component system cell cycle response regulator DivK
MTKKVLIVEDNELNMKLFHDLLGAHGIDTVQVRDGKLAYDTALEHMPDLIIMDIQLPEISGLDVTRQLKANPVLRPIPVIAVTAFAMKGDEQKIREGGCEDYISKPISVSSFIEVVKKHLSKGDLSIAPTQTEEEKTELPLEEQSEQPLEEHLELEPEEQEQEEQEEQERDVI